MSIFLQIINIDHNKPKYGGFRKIIPNKRPVKSGVAALALFFFQTKWGLVFLL
jgi:hypothetical protein